MQHFVNWTLALVMHPVSEMIELRSRTCVPHYRTLNHHHLSSKASTLVCYLLHKKDYKNPPRTKLWYCLILVYTVGKISDFILRKKRGTKIVLQTVMEPQVYTCFCLPRRVNSVGNPRHCTLYMFKG